MDCRVIKLAFTVQVQGNHLSHSSCPVWKPPGFCLNAPAHQMLHRQSQNTGFLGVKLALLRRSFVEHRVSMRQQTLFPKAESGKIHKDASKLQGWLHQRQDARITSAPKALVQARGRRQHVNLLYKNRQSLLVLEADPRTALALHSCGLESEKDFTATNITSRLKDWV